MSGFKNLLALKGKLAAIGYVPSSFGGDMTDISQYIGGPKVKEPIGHHKLMKREHETKMSERFCVKLDDFIMANVPLCGRLNAFQLLNALLYICDLYCVRLSSGPAEMYGPKRKVGNVRYNVAIVPYAVVLGGGLKIVEKA